MSTFPYREDWADVIPRRRDKATMGWSMVVSEPTFQEIADLLVKHGLGARVHEVKQAGFEDQPGSQFADLSGIVLVQQR